MKTNLTAQEILASTYAKYEASHSVWFRTSVYTQAGRDAKAVLDADRDEYLAACNAVERNTISM